MISENINNANEDFKDEIEAIKNSSEKIISVTFSVAIKNKSFADEISPVPEGKICQRIKIKTTQKHDKVNFFAEYFTEKQSFHKNISIEQLLKMIEVLAGNYFKSVIIRVLQDASTIQIISMLANKKGKIRIIKNTEKKSSKYENTFYTEHKKNYLLPEGIPVPFLVYLGVMTENGKIINAKYNKFRQINRFLEFVNDILPQLLELVGKIDSNRPLRIVDFGCGKSYLTFAIHYFLVEIKKLPVQIFGLDLKDDVIETCNNLVKKLNCKDLSFSKGDIADYDKQVDSIAPDLMITLHACDTATDYALDYGIRKKCSAILSVPCCQHEANAQLAVKNADNIFEPLLRYGLIKERFASLVTDATRCSVLEKCGYNVQVLEFIDMSHTPKNILIRATRRKTNEIKPIDDESLTKSLGISLSLQQLIKKN